MVGAVTGLAGLLALAAGAGGLWPFVLIAGFAAPLVYLLGVLAVTATAAKTLSARSLLALPLVLATMHVCWGIGFLTSPRHLVPGLGSRNQPAARPDTAQNGAPV
jgi:hypothetical protein